MSDTRDLSDLSLLELFRAEVEGQTPVLTNALVSLESAPRSPSILEALMRSAHSLKGAGRIVNLDVAVKVAHAMEDCFSSGQRGELVFTPAMIDLMLRGVDLLSRISQTDDASTNVWSAEGKSEVADFVSACVAARTAPADPTIGPPPVGEAEAPSTARATQPEAAPPSNPAPPILDAAPDRVIRMSADALDRVLGLAGESLVASRWLPTLTRGLRRIKHRQYALQRQIDFVQSALDRESGRNRLRDLIGQVRQGLASCTGDLVEQLGELEAYDRQTGNRAQQLYGEALACRMRPFAEGTQGLARTVRDLARGLGKEAVLRVDGVATAVDRDILLALEAPLIHLIRNAVDHGLEVPDERMRNGKPTAGTIQLAAEHRAGMLFVTVSDDGRGIDVEAVRRRIVERNHAPKDTADCLSETEVLEFLFLPGFTLREKVTEISGRGVGLDVVQTMLREVRGAIRIITEAGNGTTFELRLPLSLSVMRALTVEIGGEGYAFPLSQISRIAMVASGTVESTEGYQHIPWNGERVGLVSAAQVLGLQETNLSRAVIPVLFLECNGREYGVVVDRLVGEQELMVQPLASLLGKVPNIAAGSVQQDGVPVLIIDVADFVHSIEGIVTGGRMRQLHAGERAETHSIRKVLVVDDSLTVRELQRKLLEAQGYQVAVAVDGMDGWNAVRRGGYDLLITDIDMPRMDGIELTSLVKRDARLRNLPVMVVSYKDREEDRQRGLVAGADYYLTKASFQDETYIAAVKDLIGDAKP